MGERMDGWRNGWAVNSTSIGHWVVGRMEC